MAKKKKPNMYETYFEWWLNDLQKLGLVRKWKKEPESLLMLDPLVVYSNVHYVIKESLSVSHNLLQPASYTRDYDVEMHRSLLDVFIGLLVPENGVYILKELRKRGPGDVFYEFRYYYILNASDIVDEFVTVSFDVKPSSSAIRFSSKLGSSREFPYNQKIMAERYGIFVNKVVPDTSGLFKKTFMPSRYLFTDGGGQLRKLSEKDNVRTASEWITSMDIKAIPYVEKS